MSRDHTLFDLAEGRRKKETGIRHAAYAHGRLLTLARRLAVAIALERSSREATADDVARRLQEQGWPKLGNEAGALFRTKDWVFTGKRILSRRIPHHAAELKVWRFIGKLR